MGIFDIVGDLADGAKEGLKWGLIIIIALVMIFGLIIPLFQSGMPQDTAEDLKDIVIDQAPELLKLGIQYCDAKDIAINEILITGIHVSMLLNAEGQTKEILNKWVVTEKVTACEVAILDNILSKEGTEKIWRNQIGMAKAMKNIQGCTLIACADEYGIIEYLEDDE